jgi:serine/threonine protein kinase
MREVTNLARTPAHRNIVKYYGWFKFQDFAVIGMELCDGTLTTFLNGQECRSYSASDKTLMRWSMLEQITAGLSVCHSRGLMHRDIKPDNSTHPPQRAVDF